MRSYGLALGGLVLAAALAACGGGGTTVASPSPTPTATPTGYNEYTIPTANSVPYGIAAGPDGNLWFTENGGNKIGRITTAGVITEFPIPTASSGPYGITAGPAGSNTLWFTEGNADKIGEITTSGTVTEFPVPTASALPMNIAAGPDGNLWFTENVGDKIGRITPAGVITEFPVPTASSGPTDITAGPDGNMWFTESGFPTGGAQIAGKIGQVNIGSGAITEFSTPTAMSGPSFITSGPSSTSTLWFSEYLIGRVAQITTSGTITEYPLPTVTGSNPDGIVLAPPPSNNNTLWVMEFGASQVANIAPNPSATPTITEYGIPTTSSFPLSAAIGSDHGLWFTESAANTIGRRQIP